MINKNNTIELAKNFLSGYIEEGGFDTTLLDKLYEIYYDNLIKNHLPSFIGGIYSFTYNPKQLMLFISKKWTPLNSCQANVDGNTYNIKILDNTGAIVLPSNFLNREINFTIDWGFHEESYIVEALLGRLIAIDYKNIKDNNIGVDSITQSFDMTSITKKVSDVDNYAKYYIEQYLSKYWVENISAVDLGCII